MCSSGGSHPLNKRYKKVGDWKNHCIWILKFLASSKEKRIGKGGGVRKIERKKEKKRKKKRKRGEKKKRKKAKRERKPEGGEKGGGE